jgi:hypothetical protein
MVKKDLVGQGPYPTYILPCLKDFEDMVKKDFVGQGPYPTYILPS